MTLLLVHCAAFAPPSRRRTIPKIHRPCRPRGDAPMLYKAIGESTRAVAAPAAARPRRDAETLTWAAGAILAAVCNRSSKGSSRRTGRAGTTAACRRRTLVACATSALVPL